MKKNNILLNQTPTKPSVHLKAGDLISVTFPAQPLSLEPEPLPLTILYEDSSIIVVDKPPGMVVHPAAGNPSGTLVNALLYHCKDLAGINGVLRPGSCIASIRIPQVSWSSQKMIRPISD